ncbi:MAG: hypothetical protein ABI267_05870 [Ginsengibacter sp.]
MCQIKEIQYYAADFIRIENNFSAFENKKAAPKIRNGFVNI